jgi:hypothetical protein
MKTILAFIVGLLLLGAGGPASAQQFCNVNGATISSCPYATTACCTTACCVSGYVTMASTACCSSDDSYAATVAKWAVGLQLRGWLGKKGEELTRADVRDRRTKLDALREWAKKEVENRVFAAAYLRWAGSMQETLDAASVRLDRDEIASALLLHGLPVVPENAR